MSPEPERNQRVTEPVVLPLIITNDGDGFNAEIPTLPGCESWAHTEEEVIEKISELARYYMKLPPSKKIKTDLKEKAGNTIHYRLIF